MKAIDGRWRGIRNGMRRVLTTAVARPTDMTSPLKRAGICRGTDWTTFFSNRV